MTCYRYSNDMTCYRHANDMTCYRYANDMIHLMGLEGYEGDIQCNGQLLLQVSLPRPQITA